MAATFSVPQGAEGHTEPGLQAGWQFCFVSPQTRFASRNNGLPDQAGAMSHLFEVQILGALAGGLRCPSRQ